MNRTTLTPAQMRLLLRAMEAEQRQLLAAAGRATEPADLDDIALQIVNSRDTARQIKGKFTSADYYESALISADAALKAAIFTAGEKLNAAPAMVRPFIQLRAYRRIDKLSALVNALDFDMRTARAAEQDATETLRGIQLDAARMRADLDAANRVPVAGAGAA